MRKFFIVLLCMLAVIAVVSCKNEPNNNSEATPDENGGTITVRPAEDCVWGGNTDRFQFFIAQDLYEGDVIEFLLDLSESFSSIVPRRSDSTNSYAKFGTLAINSLSKEGDWYKVKVTATEDSDFLAITCMLESGGVQDGSLYCSIKNLKINGTLIDFGTFEEQTCAMPFSGAANPDAIVATITK